MEHSQGKFDGDGAIKLFYQSWKQTSTRRAVLAIVHGLGEHCGRYMNIVNCLVPAGYAVYGFDLRGHGKSPGQRGFIHSWSEYREDVHAYIRMVAEREPHCPVFIYGHSMGGLVVLDYVLHYPDGLSGVIASAPAVGKIGLPQILFLISRVLSIVYPRLSLPTTLDATTLSRDPAVAPAYRSDPLVHGLGTPRLGTEALKTKEWTVAHAADLRLPFLLIHGTADRLASVDGSRKFFDKVTSPDKKYIEYADNYHECHNDIEFGRVTAEMKEWLDERLLRLAP